MPELAKGETECVHVSCAIKIRWFSCKIPRLISAALLLFMVTKEELTSHGGEIQDWSLNLWPLAKLYQRLWASFPHIGEVVQIWTTWFVHTGKSVLVGRCSSMQIVDTPILCKAVGKELYGPCLAAWQSGDKRASSLPQDHSGEAGKRPAEVFSVAFC